MAKWNADIMSDHQHEGRLQIEFLFGDVAMGRLYFDDAEQLQIEIYGSEFDAIPVEWLLNLIQRFESEVRPITSFGRPGKKER